MKKIYVLITVLIFLGAGYYLIGPFFINNTVNEAVPINGNTEEYTSVILKEGTITGFDAIHRGSGTVRIVSVGDKTYIRFEEDFTVTNGPDLYVGLGAGGRYIKGSELAALKGTSGSQNYLLPEGIDPEEVWIWCRAFSTPFAKAVLN